MKPEEKKYICIYAAASNHIAAPYFQVAQELGTLLAQHGYGIINGAGNTGLMQAVSDAALQKNGYVTGIIPHFMVTRGWHHKRLTHLIETETMHERKQLMAQKSQGVIALPGGCGTLEEILEIITWKQLGIYNHPIVILNIQGFYNSLLSQLDHACTENFMQPTHLNLWKVASTAKEAIRFIQETE